MRLFLALLPDADLEENLCQIQKDLLDPGLQINPENLHLTLAFLGDCHDSQINPLSNLLENMSLPWQLDPVNGGELQVLVRDEKQFMTWAWDELPLVKAIFLSLKQELEYQGFELPKRPFKPHITLSLAYPIPSDLLDTQQFHVYGSFRSLALLRSTKKDNRRNYSIVSQRLFGEE